MLKRYPKIIALASALTIFSACGYEDPEYTQAIVRDFGASAVDGCGYMLEIPNKAFYSPDFLPSGFRQDGLKVEIKYLKNDTVHVCGIGAVKYPKLS